MTVKRGTSTGVFVLGSLACLLLVQVDFTQAKRGCTAFGHSCFGGHGKRSDGELGLGFGLGPFIPLSQQREQQAQVELTPDEETSALHLSPAYNSNTNSNSRSLIARPIIKLSPLLKQWLQTYRRSSDAATDLEKK